jgi:REP element-mobilizing transposase RayT
MLMNDAGNNANECWLQIPLHFPIVILHDHIIMPNHIHGIIELIPVGVENFQPLHPIRNEFQKIIPHSIGSIVRGFKIGVTKWFRNNV